MLEHISVAQINAHVGDIPGNAERIRRAATQAGGALVVFPELALCGYPPGDILLRPGFIAHARQAIEALAQSTANGSALLIGAPWEENGALFNCALLLAEGRIAHIARKQALPNYGVFDEKRYFIPGVGMQPVKFQGRALGILVCEDLWEDTVTTQAKGVDALIVLNASPYEAGKQEKRITRATAVARRLYAPVVYVNLLGAQDGVVFDGGSFAVDAAGALTAHAPQFNECCALLSALPPITSLAPEEEVWNALTLGLRDYVRKNNFSGVVLGLSGGIDSALVATLAGDALGKENVAGALLPSQHTSTDSNEDALALAHNLGIRTVTLPIEESFHAHANALAPALAALAPQFADWQQHLAVGGNLQARIRGALLMALSNATGHMLLSTSNKSETAVGYTTLYGDACGGYAPIKDVYKTHVYALARWRNIRGAVIPERSISKAPTAELAPGQTDQDQLPPYEMLDAILTRLIEQGHSIADIAQTYDAVTVKRVAHMLRISEYKRRQMPPGTKISSMLFGRDWRYPLTNAYSEW